MRYAARNGDYLASVLIFYLVQRLPYIALVILLVLRLNEHRLITARTERAVALKRPFAVRIGFIKLPELAPVVLGAGLVVAEI